MDFFDIFDILSEEYIVKNELAVIEAFAGYGSQLQSLNYIREFFGIDKVKYKHHKICEWAMNSIIAYADLHRNDLPFYNTDFSKPLTKNEIAEYLFKKGVSIDYSKPATLDQLKRVKEDKLRLCYNAIQWSNNLVDVARVKGSDLEIDNSKRDYLFTFSFPCQNLSLAGKMANLKKKEEINEENLYDIENRSNMLWQVVRIIRECYNLGYEHMPTIMLLENVPMLHSKDNMDCFKEMINIFEKLGYSVWWDDLTATDFGIPQTRNRTFVIFILNGKNGETYKYNFPKPVPLTLRLKDLLESNVDEKYYLSEKTDQIDFIGNYSKSNFNQTSIVGKNGIAPTVTENHGQVTAITENVKPKVIGGIGEMKSNGGTQYYQQDRIYDENCAISVTTSFNPNYQVGLRIRKLTPRECFRLMGLKNKSIDLLMEHQNNSSSYRLAGDSIVCYGVLTSIFCQLFGLDYKKMLEDKEWWKNGN